MSGWDDWPTGIAAGVRLDALPAAERTILAALAVVGRASLSPDELATLVETADVTPLIEDLVDRGLVRTDERRRYSLLGHVAADIRKLNETIDTAGRLTGYFETLAHGGKLTATRLEQDAEAVLGIAAWGAEVRRWETVLEFVKTVQAAFGLAARFHEQRVLLELGRTAAVELGDRDAELWCIQQLDRLADTIGDATARLEYTQPADSFVQPKPRTSPLRIVLAAVTAVALAGAGVAIGFLVGRDSNAATTTTVTNNRVVTQKIAGGTVTQTVSTTAPGTLRITATTVTSVSTELATTTVTVTAPVNAIPAGVRGSTTGP